MIDPERIKEWLEWDVTREILDRAETFWLDALKRVLTTENVERQIGVVQGITDTIEFMKRGGE